MQGNWITLHRKIKDHWIYSDAEKLKAWITILIEVNHSPQKILIKNEVVEVGRGESAKSLDTWAKLFGKGWNRSKVRRFINVLKTDTMVVTIPTHNTTHLRVCNYDTYQSGRNADETQMKRRRNADETQMTTNNNDNNGNNENNENNDKKQKRFSPPSMSDVTSLFLEKGSNQVEAEKFFYFYESKGWMVGKSKMKSWQSSVGGWIARNKSGAKSKVSVYKNPGEDQYKDY